MIRRRAPALLAATLAAAWLAGFVWFVHTASQTRDSGLTADGIVVLTGGADRIVTGIRLLSQNRGRVLLISGAGRGAELADMLRGTGIDPVPLAPRITLGHAATTTTGNADETANWVQANALHSLLVVTATYHMRRAITELQRSLPATRLLPVPVLPPALRHGGLATVRLLAGEYTKWLAAQLWLGRLNPAATSGTNAGPPRDAHQQPA